MSSLYFLVIACGVLALAYGWFTSRQVLTANAGSTRMQEISGAVQVGARAYLNRQYRAIATVGVVVLLVGRADRYAPARLEPPLDNRPERRGVQHLQVLGIDQPLHDLHVVAVDHRIDRQEMGRRQLEEGPAREGRAYCTAGA